MTHRKSDIIDPDDCLSLSGLFAERVRRTPESTAYLHFDKAHKDWARVSWREAWEQVSRWQQALLREQLQVGDRVAIAVKNSVEWVYMDQAALALGLVVVPLYTDDRPENVSYIINDASVRVLLVQDLRYWTRLKTELHDADSLQRVVVVSENEAIQPEQRVRGLQQWLKGAQQSVPTLLIDSQALASIVYTSGTTGRPKGVMLSHWNMLSIAHGSLCMETMYSDDLFLSFLPLSHTLERTGGYYLTMMAGCSVAYARSVQQLAEDLLQVRPTVMMAVPRIFERFYARIQQQMEKQSGFKRWMLDKTVQVGWRRFEVQQGKKSWHPGLLLWPLLRARVANTILAKLGGRLRLAVSGGAALGTPVAKLFTALGLPILQGYGLTETSPVISVNVPDDNDPFSVGIPLPGVEVRIGDQQELLVKTPGMMLGYWNNEQATKEIIDADGWLHTGDQVSIRDRHIYITGRIKDILVLSNGEKIPPGDMEGAISLDSLFDQVMVIGEGLPFLGAVMVLNPEKWPELAAEFGLDPSDPASLLHNGLHTAILNRVAGLLREFPGYAKVRRVILSLEPWTVERGLMTPTLKVKRAKVLASYQDEIDTIYAAGKPGRAA